MVKTFKAINYKISLKLTPLTSEDRLKDLPSIYNQIAADWAKKIKETKKRI